MPINDKRLVEVAKAITGESYETTGFLAFSSSTNDVDTSATTFATEVGARKALVRSRNNNTIEMIATRLSTDVVDTVNGDQINKIGTFLSNVSTQQFEESNLSGIRQTVNFDVEFVINLNVTR